MLKGNHMTPLQVQAPMLKLTDLNRSNDPTKGCQMMLKEQNDTPNGIKFAR